MFVPLKNNVGNDHNGRAFGTEMVRISPDIMAPRNVWGEEVTITADEALGAIALLHADPTAGTAITTWLDQGQMDIFGISAHKADDNGTLGVYVPLTTVQDETGANRVAFQGRMFYQPKTTMWGSAHQARLVWLVQMLRPEQKQACHFLPA